MVRKMVDVRTVISRSVIYLNKNNLLKEVWIIEDALHFGACFFIIHIPTLLISTPHTYPHCKVL